MKLASRSRRSNYWLATSPLWIYGLSFFAVILLYELAWSTLYPPLSFSAGSFLLATSLFVALIAIIDRFLGHRRQTPNITSYWIPHRVIRSAALLYAFAGLEFTYAGGIPILLILSGTEYDYREFGIPTLHVIFYGIYWYLSIHWFSLWLRTGRRYLLVGSLALLAINILIVNRGAMIQALIAIGVLYITHRGIRLKIVTVAFCAFALVIWGFGVIGDARMSSMGIDSEATIFAIGEAASSYPQDQLGSGPFWFYLYASSPLANWELNVLHNTTIYADNLFFIARELLPDFIGKHLLTSSQMERSPMLVTDALTVSSAYGRAYFLAGWIGCFLVYTLFLIYYFAARIIFRKTEYFDSALATMAAGSALMIFFNMLAFTGFVGPLLVAGAMRFATQPRRQTIVRSSKHDSERKADAETDFRIPAQ